MEILNIFSDCSMVIRMVAVYGIQALYICSHGFHFFSKTTEVGVLGCILDPDSSVEVP